VPVAADCASAVSDGTLRVKALPVSRATFYKEKKKKENSLL
jgi:hypothetical protein